MTDAIKRESRTVQAIKQLVIRGSMDVVVSRGEPSMTVIAERPEEVVTEIRKGVLTVSQRPMGSGGGVVVMGGSHHSSGEGAVHIGSVTIANGIRQTQVFFGPVGNVVAGDIVNIGGMVMCGQHVTVEISLPELQSACIEGSGDLSLEDVSQDDIELEINGSGTVIVAGKVKRLNVEISGSGDVKAKDLITEIADLRVAGSGDIKAHVTQSLTARIAGSGDIKIWGNPAQRDTRVSGSGDIRFR